MKKTFAVASASFAFLAVCSVSAYLVRGLFENRSWVYLLIGLGTLAVSAVLAAFAGQKSGLNILSFLVSGVALGFCIRAWYIVRELENTLPMMLLIAVASTAYIWIFHLVTLIPAYSRHKNAFIAAYLAVTLIVYLIVVFATKTTYVSTFGYYILIESAFIIAMSTEVSGPRELIRKLTLSSYSVFAAAVFIAVAIALAFVAEDCDCDCDCCDPDCCCLDECDLDIGKKRKKRIEK